MTTEQQTTEIRSITRRCHAYWVFTDVPRDRAAEMTEELEGHLRDRVADGGTTEDVVGNDLEAFAAAWAEEATEPPTAGRRLIAATAVPLTAGAGYGVARHLLALVTEGTTAFPLTWLTIALLVVIVGVVWDVLRCGLLRKALVAPPGRGATLLAVGFFGVPIALAIVSGFVKTSTVMTWRWEATAVLFVLAVLATIGAEPRTHRRS